MKGMTHLEFLELLGLVIFVGICVVIAACTKKPPSPHDRASRIIRGERDE